MGLGNHLRVGRRAIDHSIEVFCSKKEYKISEKPARVFSNFEKTVYRVRMES